MADKNKDQEAAEMQAAIDAKAAATAKAQRDDAEATAQRMIAEQKEKEALRPKSTPLTKAISPAEAFPGEETVTFVFPRRMFCWTDDKRKVQFEAGTQQVPVSLKDNWYLKACGAKPYMVS